MKRKIIQSAIAQWIIGLFCPVSIKGSSRGYDYLMKAMHHGHHYTFDKIKIIFETKSFLKQRMHYKYSDPFGREEEDIIYFDHYWSGKQANKRMIEIELKETGLKLDGGLHWIELILPAKEKITMIFIGPKKENLYFSTTLPPFVLKNRTNREQKVTLFKP